MAKLSKNRTKVEEIVDRSRKYSVEEAASLVKKAKFAKFDETVDIAVRLGVNPKHADQMVRGTVVLPHGLGKSVRVLVLASGEKQREAQDAGGPEDQAVDGEGRQRAGVEPAGEEPDRDEGRDCGAQTADDDLSADAVAERAREVGQLVQPGRRDHRV